MVTTGAEIPNLNGVRFCACAEGPAMANTRPDTSTAARADLSGLKRLLAAMDVSLSTHTRALHCWNRIERRVLEGGAARRSLAISDDFLPLVICLACLAVAAQGCRPILQEIAVAATKTAGPSRSRIRSITALFGPSRPPRSAARYDPPWRGNAV